MVLRQTVLAAVLCIASSSHSVASAGDGSGTEFRLLAGTSSGGAHPYSLVELQTNPSVELPVITDTLYMPALDMSPSGQLFGAYTNLYRVDLTNGTLTSIGTIHTAAKSSVVVVGMAFGADDDLPFDFGR